MNERDEQRLVLIPSYTIEGAMQRKLIVWIIALGIVFGIVIISIIQINKVSVMKKRTTDPKVTIGEIKAKHERELLKIEGVQGVGIGEKMGKTVIKVYVIKKTETLQKKIPAQIEGYPVDIEVTGEFQAY